MGLHGRHLWSKEPRVNRIGVGAPNQFDVDNMMSGDHPGIAGVELRFEPLSLEPAIDRVNAVRDDQYWAFLLLGQEITHRSIQGAHHAHRLADLGDQRKGAFDLVHRRGRLLGQ